MQRFLGEIMIREEEGTEIKLAKIHWSFFFLYVPLITIKLFIVKTNLLAQTVFIPFLSSDTQTARTFKVQSATKAATVLDFNRRVKRRGCPCWSPSAAGLRIPQEQVKASVRAALLTFSGCPVRGAQEQGELNDNPSDSFSSQVHDGGMR